jgi:hypothetical protein
MLQELYSETGAAAQAIVEEVAPAVNETTKEEIAGAAVDRAEAIADHIADTVKLEQSEHTAIVEACSQVIYAETLAELADNAKITALESLFTEEYVQNFYAELEAEQQQYAEGEKTTALKKVGGFLKENGKNAGIGAAAGTGVGAVSAAVAARKAARAKGLQPGTPEYRKFIAKRAAVGGAAGAAVGAGAGLGAKSAIAGGKKVIEKFKKQPAQK